MADKNTCRDRDGKEHFGEYGWYDGYIGSIGNCRCGLNSRGGACKDVDLCIEESHNKIANGQLNTNIVSYNLDSMVAGEKQKEKERKEDKEMEDIRRQKEKEEAEKIKQEKELGGKTIKEVKDDKGASIKICPYCDKPIENDLVIGEDGKTYHKPCIGKGPIILTEPKKEESKKEEKKEEKVEPLDEEKETELMERKEYDHKCSHCGKTIGEKEIVDKGDGKTRHRSCGGVIKFKEAPKKEEPKKEAKEEVKIEEDKNKETPKIEPAKEEIKQEEKK